MWENSNEDVEDCVFNAMERLSDDITVDASVAHVRAVKMLFLAKLVANVATALGEEIASWLLQSRERLLNRFSKLNSWKYICMRSFLHIHPISHVAASSSTQ